MEDKTYNFKMDLPYLGMMPFKQKALNVVIMTISGSALVSELSTYSYGIAEASDAQGTDITVTLTDKFMRGKINCIVFNMKHTAKNPGVYDKCFIYQTTTNPGYYGYVLYNSETGNQLHKYGLDLEDDRLCQYLKQSIASIQRSMFFNYYSKKFDDLRKYNPGKRHIMSVADYNDVVNKWKEFVKSDTDRILNYFE